MRSGAIGFIAVLSATPLAFAHELQYSAALSGAAQNPPNGSLGNGLALVMLDLDLVTMDVHLAFDQVSSGASSAAIHGLAPTPLVGTAIVATPMLSFPTGVTTATYEHTIDLASGDSYTSEFVGASGGTVSDALNHLVSGLIHGQMYLNISSSSYPDGEIRGFLTTFPDASDDGEINTLDFNAVAMNFGVLGTEFESGDFNVDGYTNAMDFSAIASRFGDRVEFPSPGASLAPSSPAPEPAVIGLITSAGIVSRRRRTSRDSHSPGPLPALALCLAAVGALGARRRAAYHTQKINTP
jgi:hypothetical protein